MTTTLHSPSTEAHCEQADEARPAACPFCSSEHWKPAADVASQPWKVVECLDCGQWHTAPRPSDADWDELYPESYKPHGVSEKKKCPTGVRTRLRRRGLTIERHDADARPLPSWWRMLRAKALTRRDPYLHLPQGNARLLDVGCGNGSYLAAMRELGWEVVGLEKSVHAVQQARARFDLDIHVGSACDWEDPGLGTFDLITSWQVLEHIEAPRRALARLRTLLAPGTGRLLLTVPNCRSLGARVFGSDWIGWDLPRHVTHFSKETICRMLAAEGYQVVYAHTINQSGWLRHSARRAQGVRRLFASKPLSRTAGLLAVRRDAGESLLVAARVV